MRDSHLPLPAFDDDPDLDREAEALSDDDRLISRYVDGQLDGEERATLERRAASDPVLREELDLALEIERAARSALQSSFGGATIGSAAILSMRPRMRSGRWAGLAAAAALTVGLVWLAWPAGPRRSETDVAEVPASDPSRPVLDDGEKLRVEEVLAPDFERRLLDGVVPASDGPGSPWARRSTDHGVYGVLDEDRDTLYLFELERSRERVIPVRDL